MYDFSLIKTQNIRTQNMLSLGRGKGWWQSQEESPEGPLHLFLSWDDDYMVCSPCNDLSVFNLWIFLYTCFIELWEVIFKMLVWPEISQYILITDSISIYTPQMYWLYWTVDAYLSQTHSDKKLLIRNLFCSFTLCKGYIFSNKI